MPIAPGHRQRSERGRLEDQSQCPTARPPGSVCSSLVPGRIYRQCSTGRCASPPNGRETSQQGHSGPQKSLCVNWRWTAWERLQAPPGVSPLPFFTRKYSQYGAGSTTGEVRGWYPPIWCVSRHVRTSQHSKGASAANAPIRRHTGPAEPAAVKARPRPSIPPGSGFCAVCA